MSATTVTLREFRCDAPDCRMGGRYLTDADAGRDNWAIVTINGDEYAVCGDHKNAINAVIGRL